MHVENQPKDQVSRGKLEKSRYECGEKDVLSAHFLLLRTMASEHPRSVSPSSVELLQHRWHIYQAELTAEVTHNGSVVQHQQLPHTLAITALTQVDGLQQVTEVQVPEGHTALAPGHQQRLRDDTQACPTAHFLLYGVELDTGAAVPDTDEVIQS